jgi:RNA polymerase sigma factor (sigma-70 family)
MARRLPAYILNRSRNVPWLSTLRSVAGRINTVARAFSKHGWRQYRTAIMLRPKKNFSAVEKEFAALSDRQQQVVTLLCDGLSNSEIAQNLGVSEGTVKNHLHIIYEKLGVVSRFELMIALAARKKSRAD